MRTGALYPQQTKCLFADLLLFGSGEGDETTSPSFTASNVGIDTSSVLLKALIAK